MLGSSFEQVRSAKGRNPNTLNCVPPGKIISHFPVHCSPIYFYLPDSDVMKSKENQSTTT